MRYFEINQSLKPRVFYRGTMPGRTERIKTGDQDWDRRLFASSNLDSAKMYGEHITKFLAKSDAKILYEGTALYRSLAKGLVKPGVKMLPVWSEIVRRAEAKGYDAVWFKNQGDVGTVIINPNASKIY
jgi:hypothetical protein